MDYCTKDTVTSAKDQEEIATTLYIHAGSLHKLRFKGIQL